MEKNHKTAWLKFWLYFRFPFGLFILTSNFLLTYINNETWTLGFLTVIFMCTDILFLVLSYITYYFMYNRKYLGNVFIKIYLIFELIYIATVGSLKMNYINIIEYAGNIIFTIVIIGLIWTLPNFIYFSKRKWWFEKTNNKINKKFLYTVTIILMIFFSIICIHYYTRSNLNMINNNNTSNHVINSTYYISNNLENRDRKKIQEDVEEAKNNPKEQMALYISTNDMYCHSQNCKCLNDDKTVVSLVEAIFYYSECEICKPLH